MSDWMNEDSNILDEAFGEEPKKEEPQTYDYTEGEEEQSEVEFEGLDEAFEEANNEVPTESINPDTLEDHERQMWNTIDKFEDRAWSSRTLGIPTGWSDLDKAFDGGLQTGWTVIAGDSNIGKSGFISQLAWQIAEVNDNVYVLDFTLDDPMHDKLPRVIGSMNKVIINAVRNPNAFKQYPKMIDRRNEGVKKLRNMVNRYKCFDSSYTTDIDKIEETVREHMIYLDEEGTGRKLVVLIDNFHDITTSNKEGQGDEKRRYTYLAERVSDMATKYDCPVLTSAEFKKMNGFRRPQVDDIREAVKIKYEAKAILLCYNEVSLKGEAAGIYFERQGEPAKQPVFEVKFGKNKFGSFKGRLFYEFYPEMAYFAETTEEVTNQYNNAIYSQD